MQITIKVYNSTGGTITLAKSIGWDGFFGNTPPERIKNGELGEFVIVGSGMAAGAVVYRFQNGSGGAATSSDCLIAFENPTIGQNKVVTMIGEQGRFHNNLDVMHSTLFGNAGPFCEDKSKPGCISIATITRENYSTCVVTIGVKPTKNLAAVLTP